MASGVLTGIIMSEQQRSVILRSHNLAQIEQVLSKVNLLSSLARVKWSETPTPIGTRYDTDKLPFYFYRSGSPDLSFTSFHHKESPNANFNLTIQRDEIGTVAIQIEPQMKKLPITIHLIYLSGQVRTFRFRQ
jgi:hypothetical protein